LRNLKSNFMVKAKLYKKYRNLLSSILRENLLTNLEALDDQSFQRSPQFLEWIGSDLTDIAEKYVLDHKLLDTSFMKRMAQLFETQRFELLLKRWMVEYYLRLFKLLDSHVSFYNCKIPIILEDNSLNQYGVKQYCMRFGHSPCIQWEEQSGLLKRIIRIVLNSAVIIYDSLKNGLTLRSKKDNYVVMREALWPLCDRGYYFRDDFLVDGNMIKKKDLLLFSRSVPVCELRLKAYRDAKKSEYAHFTLGSVSLSSFSFFCRIIPKYIIGSSKALLFLLNSDHYALCNAIFLYFAMYALPYEQAFSHYRVISELGHNYFSASHIPEAIICQNYGVRYYLMHWSDNSLTITKWAAAFLGCDKLLVWGKAHIQNEGNQGATCEPTGYVFKNFVNKIKANKKVILERMGVEKKREVITFFDETFGSFAKMTEGQYVTFWETALKLALAEKEHTILIKPKDPYNYKRLSDLLKEKFLAIKVQLEKAENVRIVNSEKWSFIEAIGVSDVVVTQGMTSSATIAIICGIKGLYFDQAHYEHPFRHLFMNKIVFDDPEKLLIAFHNILHKDYNFWQDIPESLLRQYDAYPDDRGINVFREILSGRNDGITSTKTICEDNCTKSVEAYAFFGQSKS